MFGLTLDWLAAAGGVLLLGLGQADLACCCIPPVGVGNSNCLAVLGNLKLVLLVAEQEEVVIFIHRTSLVLNVLINCVGQVNVLIIKRSVSIIINNDLSSESVCTVLSIVDIYRSACAVREVYVLDLDQILVCFVYLNA